MANGLQAQQICTRAAGMAGVPGMTAQAGDFLNAILASLCRNYNFEINRKLTTLSVNAGTTQTEGGIPYAIYNLPADYLRSANILNYQINGANFIMHQIPLDQFQALPIQSAQTNNPDQWASDLNPSPPTIRFFPVPNIAFTLNLRYYFLQPDITTPSTSSTVPWFPNTRYLLYKTAADLMGYTADQRQAEPFLMEAQKELEGYMRMFNDDQGYARQIQLDSRYFGTSKVLPGTKQLPL